MNASIITIGDEILIGQIVDTNSAFISQRLSDAGFRVCSKISIGDSAEQITQSVESAIESYDLVVITGGLGPTKDDITKQTLANIFDSKLIDHPEIAAHVKALMESRGVTYNELNRGQSLLPEQCTPLFNAHGTAPGMWFERDGRVVVSLPGVPFEMKRLIDDIVIPRLRDRFSLRENIHRTMITAGLPESMLAEKIATWEDSLPNYIKLAYLPSYGRVRLRLSAYEVESSDVRAEIDSLFDELELLITQYFVGYESASIESIVHRKLTERAQTLSVAESCTGGNVASKFTAMAGASAYFLLGAVTYSNEAKQRVLGVEMATLEAWGAVSEQVAIEMARGVRRVSGSDYAVATTGIAGPTGGSDQKPVGTVWFGVATPTKCYAVKQMCGTDRDQIIGRATAYAISIINEALE